VPLPATTGKDRPIVPRWAALQPLQKSALSAETLNVRNFASAPKCLYSSVPTPAKNEQIFRIVDDVIEVVRILHERMPPRSTSEHLVRYGSAQLSAIHQLLYA
jgi:hypothetical protein